MAKTIEARLDAIEDAFGSWLPGQDEALEWDKKKGYGLANWLWRNELYRPDGVPKWYPKYTRPGTTERREAMREWRISREESWKKDYWTRDWGHKHGESDFYQAEGDPDVPSELQAKWLCGALLASIPPIAFEWGKRYLRILFLGGPPAERLRKYVERVASYYAVLENRAKYWRERLGPQDIYKIKLPLWARDLYRRRNVEVEYLISPPDGSK
jgi:hypothetical protein